MRERSSWPWMLMLLVNTVMMMACREKSGDPKGAVSVSEPAPATEEACAPQQPGMPKPTQLLYLGSTAAEYGDSLPLSARLTDETGQPLVGRELRFVLGTLEAIATTGEFGVAQVSLTPTAPPASLPLTVSFAGDATLAPASASATVVITRAGTVTQFRGPTLIQAGTPQQVRATLTRAHNAMPIAGRTLLFEAGGAHATGTTDAAGVATASFSWNSATTGAVVLRVSFAGDEFYEPSSDESRITRYLPTSFTLWGGNTPGLRIGQRVNFWGHSWEAQVASGDYAAHAEFKGYAVASRAFALCQPMARTEGEPRLDPACWSSKGGQVSPPASLPEYIGVLVTNSIAKAGEQISGNVAALVVLKVDAKPAYGPVPGKPGWGTLVAVIEGGLLFPPPPSLAASQGQPLSMRPGQDFEVQVEVTNTSQLAAEQVVVRTLA